MAAVPKYHPKTEFRIEPPSGKLKSYRIRYKSLDTENKWVQIQDPRITLANDQMKAGEVSPDHTKDKLKGILAELYVARDKTKKIPPFMKENLALVERMWAEKYTTRKKRRMKRPEKSRSDLMRAAEAAGKYPLDTCSIEALEEHLDATLGDKPNIHNRRITWINSILQWLGREKLEALDRKDRPRVKYLTEKEFDKILPLLPDDTCRLLASVAFYTGLRLGEIYYVLPAAIRSGHIVVEQQMTDIPQAVTEDDPLGYKITSTKTEAIRDAFLAPQAKADLRKWAAIPLIERAKHRTRSYAPIIKRACLKAFPTDPTKHLNFHALRHCNAIWMLQKGATMYEVAQHLGNHYTVTERYYSGFELKKESLDRLKQLFA